MLCFSLLYLSVVGCLAANVPPLLYQGSWLLHCLLCLYWLLEENIQKLWDRTVRSRALKEKPQNKNLVRYKIKVLISWSGIFFFFLNHRNISFDLAKHSSIWVTYSDLMYTSALCIEMDDLILNKGGPSMGCLYCYVISQVIPHICCYGNWFAPPFLELWSLVHLVWCEWSLFYNVTLFSCHSFHAGKISSVGTLELGLEGRGWWLPAFL